MLSFSHSHKLPLIYFSKTQSKTNIHLYMFSFCSLVYPEMFSSCSQQQLSRFLEEINPACLLDTPATHRVYGGPVCGNAFLEPGEQCDCGTAEVCATQRVHPYNRTIKALEGDALLMICTPLTQRSARILAATPRPVH